MFKKAAKKLLSLPLNLENRVYKLSANSDFAQSIDEQLKRIPISNGSRYYDRLNKRLGIICDSFLYEGFKSCCNLVYITPQNYEEELRNVDVLLITSTWHGLNHEWDASYQKHSANYEALQKIKDLAFKLDIPIAFYSKEDPPNYSIFSAIAEGANAIFTSAIECIEKYNAQYPQIPCHYLPFAVNPLLHNPIGMFGPKFSQKALFAGSWMTKYPVRTEEQRNIFDWLIQSDWDLTIVDRNYNRKNRNYYYPKEYRRYIVPNYSYADVARLYKLFPLVININSVSNSETMFAGRVYDASASGGMIISNDSIGMKRLFPHVSVINSYGDLENVLNKSQREINNIRLENIRETYHLPTVYDVVRTIFDKSQNGFMEAPQRSVLVVANKITPSIEHDFNNQSYSSKQLVCKKLDTFDMANFDMVAFWDCDDKYYSHYLEDMVNGFRFTNCDYVTIAAEDNGHVFTEEMEKKARTVFWTKNYTVSELLSIPNSDFELSNGYRLHSYGIE